MPTTADDPDFWRKRADAARALAAAMRDPKMQSTQLRLAESYDKIARLTEERLQTWSDEREKGQMSDNRRPMTDDWRPYTIAVAVAVATAAGLWVFFTFAH